MNQEDQQTEPSGDGETIDQSQAGAVTPARQEDIREEVDEPARLLRIASTVQALLQEVKTTELDEAARQRLTDIHNRAVEDLRDAVSDDLQRELEQLTLEPEDETPSGAELRVMQAQLSGWLQGLFHGIQASIATKQMAAQQQLARVSEQQGQQAMAGQPGQYL